VIPIRFMIADTGIGIAEQDRERLFEPFVQADASTTRRFGGTGLGMAICQRLVHAMGGDIGLDSEVDVGTTFWCVIPLHRTDERAAPDAPTPTFDELRVLIVDDNAINRTVLAGQLRSWGMDAAVFDNPLDALDALRGAADHGAPYDLAILDHNMPVMDGLQLAQRISATRGLGSVHLILLTSGFAPSTLTLRSSGIAATLTKPVHRSQLYDCLATVLARDIGPEHVVPADTRPADARTGDTPSTGDRPAPRNGHVLLVEDNEINQTVAVGFLTRLGFTADIAGNGREALSMMSGTHYDAVLMDCQMPVMDGYTATAELRSREGPAQHTPVIALTASALIDDRARCIAAGMDDYIPKPVNADTMATVLARWIPTAERRDLVEPADTGVQPVFQIERRLKELEGPDPQQNRETFARIFAMFTTQAQAAIAKLETAIAEGDTSVIEQEAHRLKGSAGNIGAVAMANLCQELDTVARDQRLDYAPELLQRLRIEYTLVRDALNRFTRSDA
jgi:CheY-like chemotaxis protein